MYSVKAIVDCVVVTASAGKANRVCVFGAGGYDDAETPDSMRTASRLPVCLIRL